jgi:hypothetical protein
MSRSLAASRFADDPQLEAALNDTTDSHVIFDGGGVLPRSNGPHVLLLQESLLAMRFPLPDHGADSDFGTETKVAVAMFQIEAGVERRLDLPGSIGQSEATSCSAGHTHGFRTRG